MPASTYVEAERQPSVGVDGSAISSTEVEVDPFLASRNESAGIHAEVGTGVDQEVPFSGSIWRPVVVEQTCAAGDVCCVSFPTSGRRRVGYTSALLPRSCDGTSAVSPREGDLLFDRLGRGSLVLEQGSLELKGGSLKLVRSWYCSPAEFYCLYYKY
jgi:hypothetical protein